MENNTYIFIIGSAITRNIILMVPIRDVRGRDVSLITMISL